MPDLRAHTKNVKNGTAPRIVSASGSSMILNAAAEGRSGYEVTSGGRAGNPAPEEIVARLHEQMARMPEYAALVSIYDDVKAGRREPLSAARKSSAARPGPRGSARTRRTATCSPAGGAPQAPAGDAPASRVRAPADSVAPAGSEALSGADWRKAARATEVAQARAVRAGKPRIPRKGAGARRGPGMIRRLPPETPGGAA
jgi:hypothetical protein